MLAGGDGDVDPRCAGQGPAATEAGRAASLTAMARGLSITDAAAASRNACAAVTGD